MKTNYHTHTSRCMHATGSDEDYVKSALKNGFDVLGFSDHTPWNYSSEFRSGMRMHISELDGYVNSIIALREKYRDQIEIKLGLECEYFPKYMGWLKEAIDKYNIDYVIFGNHYYMTDEIGKYWGGITTTPEILEYYCDYTIEGMETGIYTYVAHPDLFMRCYPKFDKYCEKVSEKICRRAKELNIPIEYNLAGMLYKDIFKCSSYPQDEFWQIAAEQGCKAVIGYDAHDNEHLETDLYRDKALAHIRNLNMEIVEYFEFDE